MSLGLHCGCCKLCLSGCLHSCVVAWGLHVLTGRAYGTTVRCRGPVKIEGRSAALGCASRACVLELSVCVLVAALPVAMPAPLVFATLLV